MEAILATQRPKESSYEAARQTTEEVLAEVKVGIDSMFWMVLGGGDEWKVLDLESLIVGGEGWRFKRVEKVEGV